MQHERQRCSFTRTAYSLQVAIRRAQYTAENARQFADRIDSSFTNTAGVAAALEKECERIESDLVWLRELCIFAAENTDFAGKLRSLLRAAELDLPAGMFDEPAPPPPARRQRDGGVPSSWKIPPFGAPLSASLGKDLKRA